MASVLAQINLSDIQPINGENVDVGHFYFQYSVDYDPDTEVAESWGAIVKVEEVEQDGVWVTRCVMTSKQSTGEWSAWTEQVPAQTFMPFTEILSPGVAIPGHESFTRLYRPVVVN
jgi:hypothetical protein